VDCSVRPLLTFYPFTELILAPGPSVDSTGAVPELAPAPEAVALSPDQLVIIQYRLVLIGAPPSSAQQTPSRSRFSKVSGKGSVEGQYLLP